MAVDGYKDFAPYYDILTSNIPYRKRGEYFNVLINKYGKNSGILVDLACGTGSLSEVMSDLGYEVIGIDGSYEMLSEAMNKKYKSGNDIIYLCQDMTDLDLYGTMDICICALDSINHVIDSGSVQKIFDKVSLFLHPDGIFIFDVNTVYKHRNILADNTFVYDYDDVYCVWQNSLNDDDIIEINLDIFCRNEDESYDRVSEQFYEKAYSHKEIEAFIKNAGMELVDFYGDDSLDMPNDKTSRIVYIAKSMKNSK